MANILHRMEGAFVVQIAVALLSFSTMILATRLAMKKHLIGGDILKTENGRKQNNGYA